MKKLKLAFTITVLGFVGACGASEPGGISLPSAASDSLLARIERSGPMAMTITDSAKRQRADLVLGSTSEYPLVLVTKTPGDNLVESLLDSDADGVPEFVQFSDHEGTVLPVIPLTMALNSRRMEMEIRFREAVLLFYQASNDLPK